MLVLFIHFYFPSELYTFNYVHGQKEINLLSWWRFICFCSYIIYFLYCQNILMKTVTNYFSKSYHLQWGLRSNGPWPTISTFIKNETNNSAYNEGIHTLDFGPPWHLCIVLIFSIVDFLFSMNLYCQWMSKRDYQRYCIVINEWIIQI